jgi:hypothetical protein
MQPPNELRDSPAVNSGSGGSQVELPRLLLPLRASGSAAGVVNAGFKAATCRPVAAAPSAGERQCSRRDGCWFQGGDMQACGCCSLCGRRAVQLLLLQRQCSRCGGCWFPGGDMQACGCCSLYGRRAVQQQQQQQQQQQSEAV